MALVKFRVGDYASYTGLETKDQDTLYFITDLRQIFKGDVPYTGGIYKTVASFPDSGDVNTLYVNTANGQVCYWDGTQYVTVVKATGQTISGAGDNNTLATTKAVVDYVAAQIAGQDIGSLVTRIETAEGEIDTLQGQMTVVQGEGEGSIKKALADAKAYTDQETAKKANLEHEHTLADVTDAGALAAKDTVAEADLETTLASKINNKADKADSLAGYGITDAYTKTDADAKIAEAVANADHLKREIVAELPEVGSADEHTIYMVAIEGGEGEQKYEEFMLINGAFEKIGDSAVDLTGYATEAYVDQAESDAIQAAKTYTDTEVADAVTEVKVYADQAETDAVASAKSYADGLIAGLDVTDAEVEGQYVSAVSEVDGKVVVSRKQLPAKPVIVEGATDGTISVDGTNVPVHGLGSAAFTEAGDYATAEQGGKADTALQKEDIVTGTANGTIAVDGSDVAVKGLGSAAYTEANAYATAAQGTKADELYTALTWSTI